MNLLTVIERPSRWVPRPHVVMCIHRQPLDEVVGLDHAHAGLLSALSGCLSPEEQALVDERILPAPGRVAIAPVLVCPDEQDLGCVVVVAEVRHQGNAVVWQRLGLDDRDDRPYGRIGTAVRWFPDVGPWTFPTGEYRDAIARAHRLARHWRA